MMQDGYEFYAVKSMRDVVGNSDAVRKMIAFAMDVNTGKKRIPLLVHGPSGVGKTAAVNALAREFNWNPVELNASDYRDKETIEGRLLSAATSRTLFGSRNVIILEEIDELASKFDKGASAAISSLISKAKNPIIFTANNMWDQSISFLRGKVESVEFRKLPPETIAKMLQSACAKLGFAVPRTQIESIATRSKGDARSALNDLSVIAGSKEDMTEVIGFRDRKTDIFNLLDKVFYANTLVAPLRAMASSDVSNDMLVKWIDESIPKRYIYPEDALRAFSSLADASMYLIRAMRSQHYVYWRYANVMMSSGVALAKSRYPDQRQRYAFPSVIKSLSGSKASRRSSSAIAKKLQRYFHSSTSDILHNEMRIFARMARDYIAASGLKKSKATEEFALKFQLEPKELEYVMTNYS